MIGMFVISVFAIFGFTLLITKSKIFACKRKFVEDQYQASLVANIYPWYVKFVHEWWHAMWTCPMCLGVWVSAISVIFYPVSGYWILDLLSVSGGNWLLHCLEEFLYKIAQYFERTEEEEEKT